MTTPSVRHRPDDGHRQVAVIPVRAGTLPVGADETVAEAGGPVVLIGDGTAAALAALVPTVDDAVVFEAGAFGPARFARLLAELDAVRDSDIVLLPASPDGRDLAPRLSRALRRPLVTGAVRVSAARITAVRHGGRVEEDYTPTGPLVTTLEPGSRNVEPARGTGPARVTVLSAVQDANHGSGGGGEGGDGGEGSGGRADGGGADARCLEVLAPDPGSMDLAEAPVIIAGGAGLGGPDAFAALGRVAAGLGASVGATRVVTDAGWLGHERQIGTTGVTVSPRIYVALGISGAVQHTGGIGHPEHIVAVNLDPSCPMMAMADLAIVTDARALLDVMDRHRG